MLCNIRRSHYLGWLGTKYYVLDAQIVPNEAQLEFIYHHSLGEVVIFPNEARLEYFKNAQDHLEATEGKPSIFGTPGEIIWGIGELFYHLGAAAVSTTLGSFSTIITIQNLI